MMEQLKSTLKRNVQQYTMIIALLLIWLVFYVTTGGVFMSPRNITNLFLQMAYVGIASSTMVLIMVCGHIDLSVGSVIGFSGALIAYFLKFTGINVWLSLLITLAAGTLVFAQAVNIPTSIQAHSKIADNFFIVIPPFLRYAAAFPCGIPGFNCKIAQVRLRCQRFLFILKKSYFITKYRV